MTTLHDVGGVLTRPLDTFLVGSHNFMVTALGLVCDVAIMFSIYSKIWEGWASEDYSTYRMTFMRMDEITPPRQPNSI